MSYRIRTTDVFKKDYKRSIKRGLNISLLDEVIILLKKNGELPPKYKPHILKGIYNGLYECHIKPDWLLMCKIDDMNKVITLYRTGTHSDLF